MASFVHRLRRVVAAALIAAAATGCSTSAVRAPSTPLPTPLPTTPHGTRLCGLLGKSSVAAALGRTDVSAKGFVHKVDPDRRAGYLVATCQVSVPGDGGGFAFDVDVRRVAAVDAGIVRNARSGALPFTYPENIGIGFAHNDLYHDAAGRPYSSVESGVIRGDWAITLGIQMPAPDRDPLADVVAFVQQVIAALHLPAHPSRPYPAPVASALHG